MNTNEGKISVIIPVYRVEKYIARCLDSVINNTYQNIEIVCVNDGSPDDSLRILNAYAERDSRIVVVSQNNGGLSSARNTGIKHSTGEYVTFIDSDDWIHPNYFEILIDSIRKEMADVAICGFDQVEQYSNSFIVYDQKSYAKQVFNISIDELMHDKKFKMFKVYACGVLYRKAKIIHFFPEDVKVIEDNIFNLINLPQYKKACIINLPIYFYYFNSNSIMHTFSYEDAYKGLDWLCSFLNEKKTTNPKVIKEIVEFVYKRSLFYRYSFLQLKGSKTVSEKTKKCYETLLQHDSVIPFHKRMLYRVMVRHPGLYDMYKNKKDGKIDADSFFSLAEGKKIKY
ncbi:MAG: glycosyltransferase [Ruminococcus sp.]|nr:glycosyltransferase [Ruminococcus sp.]